MRQPVQERWKSPLRLVLIISICWAGTASAQNPPAQAISLTETHWKLTELDGSPVVADSPESQPYIYLQAQGDKLSGLGGCNRLFGSFDLSGTSLQFHSVASTLMACPGHAMDREPALIEALKLTTGFRIEGNVLELRVDERVLARFRG